MKFAGGRAVVCRNARRFSCRVRAVVCRNARLFSCRVRKENLPICPARPASMADGRVWSFDGVRLVLVATAVLAATFLKCPSGDGLVLTIFVELHHMQGRPGIVVLRFLIRLPRVLNLRSLSSSKFENRKFAGGARVTVTSCTQLFKVLNL
ncbi:hypothetical protein R1flu_002681 [Riccia fluitans]|uniref:Uncharacterized protein n=1 Tax=Riccia fluitans TaxID=41844 RepID=A0ABD1Y6U4_9MARC